MDATVKLLAAYNPQLNTDQLRFEGEETIKLLRYGAGAVCPKSSRMYLPIVSFVGP